MSQPALKLADHRPRRKAAPAFNKTTIEKAHPPATGELVLKDPKTPGLVCRVRASGRRGFYIVKKHRGRPVKLKLGDFPAMSVENARKAAIEALEQFNKGQNPADTRRVERGELSLKELWTLYCREHLDARCSPRTAKAEKNLFDLHLDTLGNRKLSDISPTACKNLHSKIGKDTRTSANRAIQLLRRLYRYAARHHGYEGKLPTAGVELFREHSRERFLSADELPAFLQACDDEGQPWADFFRMAIFTGARRSNVQAMRWDAVDLKARTWTIPGGESKNGRDVTITLPPPAVEILRTRKAEQGQSENERIKASPFVFPALRDKGGPGHLSQPARPFGRICKRAGINGVRIHDLRRTAGAWMAASGASLPMIGKALGHADLRATQIYSRLDLAPVREAVDVSVAAMTEAMNKADNKDKDATDAE
jgi:integrase